MSSEVEETLKRINSHKGVKGVLIMNSEGYCSFEKLFFIDSCVSTNTWPSPMLWLLKSIETILKNASSLLGIPIRSNLSDEDTENYAALVSQLAIKAHHVVR